MSHEAPPAGTGLISVAWWEDLASRAWRQGTQVAVPLLQGVVVQHVGRFEVTAFVVALVAAVGITIFKYVVLEVANYRPSQSTNPVERVADRVLPAVAGVVAGLGVTDLADFTRIDWGQTAVMAAAAGLLALLATQFDPADKAITPTPPTLPPAPAPEAPVPTEGDVPAGTDFLA
jgi:hypothetical protein